jgi:hypothetical protein
MPAIFLTAAMAKAHLLRPDLPDDDPDLLQKLAAAEAAILVYINTTSYWKTITADWVANAACPADVQHAMLLKVGELFRFRGDDLDKEGPSVDPDSDMSKEIVRLLRRWRDPVLV